MMKTRILALTAVVALAACSDDPTGPQVYDTEELTAELAVAPGHFHIWETTGTFTVVVTDPDGGSVADFDVIQVERRLVGSQTWGTIELEESGGAYAGTYIFDTSGTYELRVTGMRASDSEMKVLANAPNLEVVRAHSTTGGYTVSFEVFPGHIHQHDAPTFAWWFEGEHANVSEAATHPPHGSPTMSIACDAGTVDSDLTETEAGRWEADVQLEHMGDCDASVTFMGTDEAEHTYAIPIHISAAH